MKPYITLISLAALALASCGSKDRNTADEDVDNTPLVEVDIARQRPVMQTRSYTANVEADNINNIAPANPNRLKAILVDVGDHVSKGQVLVRLDPTTADQQRINLEDIEREYNRALELLRIGAGTQRAVDQLKTQLDAARTAYRNTLDNTVLTSPISGVVTARNYDPGDMTGQLPVLTVGQITPAVKVVINVNESDMAVIKNGMPVDIEFDAYPGREFAGKITRLSPAVDVSSRTFPAEVMVANSDGAIRPGMFARVSIDLGTRDNVVVPDRAVVKQTGSANKYVYTYSGGQVAFRRVELGRRIDDSYELLSGIDDGDTVVISGQSRLADGVTARLLSKSEKQ